MDYLSQITDLVRLAKWRQIHCPLTGYTERHHIVPRCFGKMFGQPKSYWNHKNNIIELTAAEHFNIHVWLYEWFKNYYGSGHLYTIKMVQGLNRLLKGKPSTNTPNMNITPEQYQYYRIEKNINEKEGYKNGTIIHPRIGKCHTKEIKQNHSKFMKSLWASGLFKRKTREISDEFRLFLSKIGEKYEYKIINEMGESIKTKNLRKFCKTNKLRRMTMMNYFKRKIDKYHRGYKIISRINLNIHRDTL